LGLIVYSGCRKPNLQVKNPINPVISQRDSVHTILGQKLENPYTLGNMRKAFRKIRTLSDSTNNSTTLTNPVRLTHKYIRFLPKDTLEYDRLVRDTVLKLYDTPLDYEIAKQGNYYHDPTVKWNLYTWLYASVPANHALIKGIQYQFLDSLYIPEEDPLLNQSTSSGVTVFSDNSVTKTNKIDINNLLNQAMTQTHNYDYVSNTKGKLSTLSYRPRGNVSTFDTRLNRFVPLEGVRMRIRRWFSTSIQFTDANGNYISQQRFKGPVNYYLFFETPRFDIRTGWFGQASINGPKKSDPWDVAIGRDDINRFYADVFRGAYRYWYGDIGGLYRPTILAAIKYAARDINGNNQGVATPGASLLGIFPQIFIMRKNSTERVYDSDEIYSTTVHETAHYTHNRLLLSVRLLDVNSMIRESWATAVELYLTKKEYQARGIANYGNFNYTEVPRDFFPTYRGYQEGKASASYTPLFIDLVDNYNQKEQIKPSLVHYINDNITGYTMPELESYLSTVHNQSALRKELKRNKPAGITDTQIDNFLEQFEF